MNTAIAVSNIAPMVICSVMAFPLLPFELHRRVPVVRTTIHQRSMPFQVRLPWLDNGLRPYMQPAERRRPCSERAWEIPRGAERTPPARLPETLLIPWDRHDCHRSVRDIPCSNRPTFLSAACLPSEVDSSFGFPFRNE